MAGKPECRIDLGVAVLPDLEVDVGSVEKPSLPTRGDDIAGGDALPSVHEHT